METVALARLAMATRFEIVLHGHRPVALRAAGEEALDEITRLEEQLSLYRPASQISAVNAGAARAPVRVEPAVFRLLQHARRLYDESVGTFDITIAPLVRCWGFMGGGGHRPTAEQITAARAKVGMDKVTLDEERFTVKFEEEGMMLDLGAIGKGYAVERAADILREAGVTSAVVQGGTSTVCAIGAPPDAAGWKAAIEYPPLPAPGDSPQDRTDLAAAESAAVRAIVSLNDESMSVSAPHGRSFTEDGKTYGHVLDPRTGHPAIGGMLAAVVLPSATETDALSTALLTWGVPGHERIAHLRPDMRTFLLVRDEAGGGFGVTSRGIDSEIWGLK